MSLLRNPLVSGGLAVAAVGFVGYQLLSSGCSPARARSVAAAVLPPPPPSSIAAAQPKPAPALATEAPQTVTAAPKTIDRKLVQSRFEEWIGSPKRDPFRRTTTKGAAAPPSPVPGWKLSAIWHQTGSRVATINGNIYQEGDEIEGYTIERIESDRVWFRGPTSSEPLGFTIGQAGTNAVPKGANADLRPASTNAPYRPLPLIEH